MNVTADIVYSPSGQLLDLYLPQGDFERVFVFFHGGGLTGGTKGYQHFMGYLTAHGVAVISAEYRMYPQARYPDFIEDAADAVKWALDRFPDKKVYVGGSSAGGYLSMMLCFDGSYLRRRGIPVSRLAGFVHNAGQPTAHFEVLHRRGLDSRRIIVDETAPLYHIGLEESYPPMLVLVSDNDMENRLEQTQLLLSTLRHFRCGGAVRSRVLHGEHCSHDGALDSRGESVFGQLILEFLEEF